MYCFLHIVHHLGKTYISFVESFTVDHHHHHSQTFSASTQQLTRPSKVIQTQPSPPSQSTLGYISSVLLVCLFGFSCLSRGPLAWLTTLSLSFTYICAQSLRIIVCHSFVPNHCTSPLTCTLQYCIISATESEGISFIIELLPGFHVPEPHHPKVPRYPQLRTELWWTELNNFTFNILTNISALH